jgi:hypothetical protein
VKESLIPIIPKLNWQKIKEITTAMMMTTCWVEPKISITSKPQCRKSRTSTNTWTVNLLHHPCPFIISLNPTRLQMQRIEIEISKSNFTYTNSSNSCRNSIINTWLIIQTISVVLLLAFTRIYSATKYRLLKMVIVGISLLSFQSKIIWILFRHKWQ